LLCSVEIANVVLPLQLLLQPSEFEKELASQSEIHAQADLLAGHVLVVRVHEVVTLGGVCLRDLLEGIASPWCSGIGDPLVAIGVEDLPKGTGISVACCRVVLLEIARQLELQSGDPDYLTSGGGRKELQAAAISVHLDASEVLAGEVALDEILEPIVPIGAFGCIVASKEGMQRVLTAGILGTRRRRLI
jgi:hypothetical protein